MPWKLWNQTNLKCQSVLGNQMFFGICRHFSSENTAGGSAKSELALLGYRQTSFGCKGSLDTNGAVSLVILF